MKMKQRWSGYLDWKLISKLNKPIQVRKQIGSLILSWDDNSLLNERLVRLFFFYYQFKNNFALNGFLKTGKSNWFTCFKKNEMNYSFRIILSFFFFCCCLLSNICIQQTSTGIILIGGSEIFFFFFCFKNQNWMDLGSEPWKLDLAIF